MKILGEGKVTDFGGTTELPSGNERASEWQTLNKSWWEQNPMRYDITHIISSKEFSREFYEEIDSRFFSSVWEIMPWKSIPFDSIVDLSSLHNKDVLEIGVGCGSHAQLLTQHSRSFTGIDLTEYAVDCTSTRLKTFGLGGTIIRMDAEHLQFQDNSFDLVWSWGVIHHSSDTHKVLKEIHRVLRPNGEAIIMVYHRSWWNTYIRGGFFYGILKGELFKRGNVDKIMQYHTDGALARYYRINEWKGLVSDFFEIENIHILGSKSQIIPLPYCKLKRLIMDIIPDSMGRFITNRPSVGFLLVCKLAKNRYENGSGDDRILTSPSAFPIEG